MQGPRVIATLLLLLASAAGANAVEIADAYRAHVIVTGTGAAERSRGLREAFGELVVRLTGDARLQTSPALDPLLGRVENFVDSIDYQDRMKGIPVHDEQGTRERPFDLRVRFRPEPVEQALRSLGIAVWPLDRPLVAIWFAVRTPAGGYVLQPQGSAGYGQRAVFAETAQRRGIPIALAPQKNAREPVTPDDIAAFDAPRIRKATARGDALLVGTLDLGDAGSWNVRWLLVRDGQAVRWGAEGVSFDAAITDGLERTARVLSGRS